MKKLKNGWTFTLSLKGLINDDVIYDRIELYMLKYGYNGIVYEDGIMRFIKLEAMDK